MKKIPFFIALFFAVFIIICFPFCLRRTAQGEGKNSQLSTYKAIITVWQLDMVEGGKGSREALLKKVAKSVESSSKGVLFSVSTLSFDGALEKMKNGVYPDVISYSCGLDLVFNRAKELESNQRLGKYGRKSYAVAWATGGYVLISKSKDFTAETCYVSQAEFSQPMIAYYLAGLDYSNVVIDKPLNAYTKFLADKNAVLIGTQRDLFRLDVRKTEYIAKTLSSFSDIIQYASITTQDSRKLTYAKAFCDKLARLDAEMLNSIGMMPLENRYNYTDSPLSAFNGYDIKSSLSICTNYQELKSLQAFFADKNVSKEEKLNRIKNIVQ